MRGNFKNGEKAILVKHSTAWISEEYVGTVVTLKHDLKNGYITFSPDGIGIMLGKKSWFKRIKNQSLL